MPWPHGMDGRSAWAARPRIEASWSPAEEPSCRRCLQLCTGAASARRPSGRQACPLPRSSVVAMPCGRRPRAAPKAVLAASCASAQLAEGLERRVGRVRRRVEVLGRRARHRAPLRRRRGRLFKVLGRLEGAANIGGIAVRIFMLVILVHWLAAIWYSVAGAWRGAARAEMGVPVSELDLVSQYVFTYYATLLMVMGDPKRDPRKHIVSIVYEIDVSEDQQATAGDDAADAKFWPIETVLNGELTLAGDHLQILSNWLKS